MVAMPETLETSAPVVQYAPTRKPLGDEERAELNWGDEALTVDAPTRPPRPGDAVICSDGYAGRVVSASLDGAGQLRTVAVRLGRLWGREVSVPAGWLEAYDRTTMRLGIERRTLHTLPSRRSDAETEAAGHRALRTAGILRATDYNDVSVTASGGLVALTGHVRTCADRLHAEGALRSVPDVLEVQNDLVADDDLVNLVAQALARDERTRRETIFVAVNHGVVILSGLRNGAKARAAAEECAARVPFVRGVSNYIEAEGILVDDAEQRIILPRVGQEVFATDMTLGRVERVIINPRNRRMTAVIVHGQFPDRRRASPQMRSYAMPLEERRLAIPSAEVSFMTPTVVQLRIDGMAVARLDDFAMGDFAQPDRAWHPPYPLTADDCLWSTT